MTEPKFSMVHQPDLYEETIVDGFAIYAFLSYSDCEESARQQDCLDDTEEEESVNGDKRTPTTVGRSPSSVGYRQSYGQRSRSDSRSSTGDTPNGSIYLESGKNMLFHRSVTRRKAGRPKGGHRRSKVQIKHEIFTDYRDPSIDVQQLNCLYNDYLQDRFKEEEENKYKFSLPKSMDENFVNLSLNALDSSLVREKPSPTVDKIKKELKPGIEDASDDYHPKKESFGKIFETPENDADLTEMISRHSKREIRLPARYHQSGLLMGSQWVIPEYGPDEKIPKKRVKIEETDEPKSPNETQVRSNQTSYQKHEQQPQRQPLSQPQLQQTQYYNQQQQQQQQSSPSPPQQPLQQQFPQLPLPPLLQKPQPHQNPPLAQKQLQQTHFKPLYSCENQRIIFSTSNSSNLADRTTEDDKSLSSDLFIETRGSVTTNVDDLSNNLNSSIKTCPSHVSQLKLHQEKLERLQLLRKQQEACGKLRENNTVINNNTSKDYPHQESTVDMIMSIVSPTDRSDLNNIDPSSSQSSTCCSPELNQQNIQNSSTMVSAYLSILNPNNSSQSSSDSPMDNSDAQDQKSPKQQELCKLYRDLHFANRPERRLIYAKSRIKPRVIKKLEVEEAIKVIEKLNKRDKQLDYIKKLLSMWNKKLILAAKVINDKDVTSKAVDVVKDVLKTYQASKSYRVTEAWDSLTKPKTTPSSSLMAISSSVFEQPQPLSQQQQQQQQSQPLQTPHQQPQSAQPPHLPPLPPPPPPLQVSQPPRQLVRPGSSVIKTTGSLSRIVMNPQAKSNSTPESRVITTLTLPVATTTLTTITSTTKTIDQPLPTEKSPTVAVISKISSTPPRIKAMVPLNQSQSSNQPSHLHIHPSLPPPPPPSLQASFSLTSLTRPPTQALPTLSTTLPNHAHLTPSILPNIHSQANMKQIPLIISPGTLNNNNLFSSTRGYGNSRHKSSGDVHLCTMPRLPLPNNVTPVSTVIANSGVAPKPTIIKPTTFLLTPNAASPTSPVYRILVKGDTLNRVLLTPQLTPHIYKKPLLREPFPLDSPVEVSVQSDNQGCN